MDREAWLNERRAAVVADYDRDAAGYDDDPYATATHRAFVDRLVATVPAGGLVLDAPCGTGQYFPRIRDAGRRVVGIDQSAGMLQQAEVRGLAERLEQLGLQEMAFEREFDGAITVDGMEHIPPEDWPTVLANLVRAVRPGARLYLTVEESDDEAIDAAIAALQDRGTPAVRGEVIEGDSGGYHYYPGRRRVIDWLAGARLEIVVEATDAMDGWGYWHLLLQTPRS
ncbi:MAG TPA: class I SAM-dependent methyltransferase [Candidatus Limnocylindrales bacterium]|nr:class I SAM-dependent methyltransferase [Candidatus Limnocylindrales bacterium]